MSTDKIKILLAEDDSNLGALLQEYLEAKNYSVKLAKNGKEGYDLFCKQEYDLCLLDVMMPLKDGFTLAKEIRVSNKNIPIIKKNTWWMIRSPILFHLMVKPVLNWNCRFLWVSRK